MSPLARVWAGSSALGFLLGLGHATWHVSVESAQVLAGVVRYPPGNPFGLYHLKLWTAVNQLSAALLWAGLSEITVSYLLSGLLGLVSISALALVVFALSQDEWLAWLAPVFIHLTPAPQYGVSYPIWLMGASHTYGVLGLSFDALVLAVLGCGRTRAGLFLLGLAPAVHPSLGAWLWIVVAAAWVLDSGARGQVRPHKRWLMAGSAVTLGSALLQYALASPAETPTTDVRPYLDAFFREWDAHRQAVDLTNRGVLVGAGTGLLALLWRGPFRAEVPPASRLLLSALVAGAVLGLSAAGLSFVAARLPRELLVLMPTRLLNIGVLLSTAVLVGLLGARRRTAWGLAGLLILVIGLMPAHRSRYLSLLRDEPGLATGAWPFDRFHVLVAAAVLLVAAAVVQRRRAEEAPGEGVGAAPLRRAVVAVLGTAPLVALVLAVREPRELRDRTNHRLFAELSRGEGTLATAAGLHLIQLRTRRPVLLDATGLDMLPYAWTAAPEVARILAGVYDIDYFHPPPDSRRMAMIGLAHNRAVWESRTREEWRTVAREFGVRDVLVHRDWDLDLPAGAANKDLLVCRIPD